MNNSELIARVWRRGAVTIWAAALAIGVGLGGPVSAGGVETQTTETGTRGAVTNLPLPRYVSMKSDESNVRRGPSLSNRIDWVFTRRNMPLQLTAEYGHWRKVKDRDGAGGWVHYAMLSGVRTVLIEKDMLKVYSRPDPQSQVNAEFEMGVVARLGECNTEWCRITAGGYRGWAEKTALWGVKPDEIRE